MRLEIPRRLPAPWSRAVERKLAHAQLAHRLKLSQARLIERQAEAALNLEDQIQERLQRVLHSREEALRGVEPGQIHAKLHDLLRLPARTFSFTAFDQLAEMFELTTCRHDTIVDDQGNPFSSYILTFLDALLVLYRPIPATRIALDVLGGLPRASLESEPDQIAFGALATTSLAPLVLMLVEHAHAQVLRAMWFALIYLDTGYRGSQRAIALEFLLNRVVETLQDGVEGTRRVGGHGHGGGTEDGRGHDAEVNRSWIARMNKVMALRKQTSAGGRMGQELGPVALGLRDICMVMKGWSGV